MSIVTMVFVFRIDTKEERRPNLKESTSGFVAIKLEISIPLVTQGVLRSSGRWKEGKTHSINLQ